jgi:hypothetical protein
MTAPPRLSASCFHHPRYRTPPRRQQSRTVEIDEGREKHPQLRCAKRCRSICKNSLEGAHPRFALFFAASLFRLVLLLLAFVLSLAFLFPALLLRLLLRHALLCSALRCAASSSVSSSAAGAITGGGSAANRSDIPILALAIEQIPRTSPCPL